MKYCYNENEEAQMVKMLMVVLRREMMKMTKGGQERELTNFGRI